MTRVGSVLVLGVVGAALLVACSDGNDGPGGESAARTTVVGGQVTSTTLIPVDTSFTGEGADEYCRLASDYAVASKQLMGQGGANPDLKQLFRDAAESITQAVGLAPPEIQSDATIVARDFGALISGLENVDYDFTRVPPDVIARLQSAEYKMASTRIEAYSKNVCRIGD